jgi:hypothetical protein
MKFFSKLAKSISNLTQNNEGVGTRDADAAIRAALAGRMSMPEMHQAIMAAQVFVPLSAPPVFEDADGYRKSWHPAVVEDGNGEHPFVAVFTDQTLLDLFTQANPAYSYVLLTAADWVVANGLPINHGLAFNVGGETNCILWPVEGVSAYLTQKKIREFEPTNTLEAYLKRGCAGEISVEESLAVLVESDLYVPSTTESGEEVLAGSLPFVFIRDDQVMSTAFTRQDLMGIHKGQMKGSATMKGAKLLSLIPPDSGLIINPGHPVGLEIAQEGIKDVVQKFVKNENAEEGHEDSPNV